jgi:hypothetical protein
MDWQPGNRVLRRCSSICSPRPSGSNASIRLRTSGASIQCKCSRHCSANGSFYASGGALAVPDGCDATSILRPVRPSMRCQCLGDRRGDGVTPIAQLDCLRALRACKHLQLVHRDRGRRCTSHSFSEPACPCRRDYLQQLRQQKAY